uniref:DUF424 family protein n=1 Tax=Thermofilum pendens TaxID=2269 RepID=A0A7C1P659_THEPE
MTVLLRVHRQQGYVIAAMCDKKLLGKTLSDGVRQVHFSEEFFGGVEVDADDVARISELLQGVDSITAFGEESITLLSKLYPSVLDAVITVCNVPYVQVFMVLFE